MTGSAWVDISDEAKDFVKKLLNRCVFLHILMFMYTVTCRNSDTSNSCQPLCIGVWYMTSRHVVCVQTGIVMLPRK